MRVGGDVLSYEPATTGPADVDGSTSDTVELPPSQIFSGPFLPQNAIKKGNFEG